MERAKNPILLCLTKHQALRSFENVVAYPPNQVYIGNMQPDELAKIPQPWYENPVEPNRKGSWARFSPWMSSLP